MRCRRWEEGRRKTRTLSALELRQFCSWWRTAKRSSCDHQQKDMRLVAERPRPQVSYLLAALGSLSFSQGSQILSRCQLLSHHTCFSPGAFGPRLWWARFCHLDPTAISCGAFKSPWSLCRDIQEAAKGGAFKVTSDMQRWVQNTRLLYMAVI